MGIKDKKKLCIIEKAISIFVSEGLANTRMADVAAAAGMSRRTLYRYYRTKEELAFAVEYDIFDQFKDVLTDRVSQFPGNGYNRFSLLIDLFTELFEKYADELRFTGEFDHYFSGDYSDHEFLVRFKKLLLEVQSVYTGILSEGIADGSIRKDIDIILTYSTLSNGFFSFSQRILIRGKNLKMEQDINPPDILKHFFTLILDSVKP